MIKKYSKKKEGDDLKKIYDIYQCVKNEDIRLYLRENIQFSAWEQMQLILHAYMSIEEKRTHLYNLSLCVDEKDTLRMKQVLKVLDICMEQIYRPAGRQLYVAENIPVWSKRNMACLHRPFLMANADIEFYSDLRQVVQMAERRCRLESCFHQKIYVYQISIGNDKQHQILAEFEMVIENNQIRVYRVFPNTQWLLQTGIAKDAINDFYSAGIQRMLLPFGEGCRIKIQTPMMKETISGSVRRNRDNHGRERCFLQPDGFIKMRDWIDLSFHEIDLRSGYTVFDWVEAIS